MLLNFLIPTQCGTSTHTWIPNNLPLKWESLFHHIDTLPLERKQSSNPSTLLMTPSLVPPFTHLYGTHLPEITIRKTLDTRSNCTRPSRKPTALIPLVGRIRGRKLGRPHIMRQEPTYIREWHHLQPKTLRLWVEGLLSYMLAHVSFLWNLSCFPPRSLLPVTYLLLEQYFTD